jgi:SAM-dependent methyltransferase
VVQDSSYSLDPAAVFDEQYRYFYADRLSDGRSMADVSLIWAIAGLGIGASVLDLGCGHGRIANRLAQRGARVVGIDISAAFLAEAVEGATGIGIPSSFVRGDLRHLPFAATFDVVICWYTTFGYFDADGDRAMLVAAFDVLRPGGRLLLDVNLLEEGSPALAPSVVVERGNDLMIEQLRFDPESARIAVRRTVIRDDVVERSTYAIRLYDRHEIRELLESVGFEIAAVHDKSVELGPLARRLVVDARRSQNEAA